MDRTDEAILACLRRNARMSASRIGKEVNLSVSSVLERIHRMEEQGIILRYAAVVDPSKLGKPLTLLMGVTMEHPRYHEGFKKAMAQEPDVTRCEYLTGELDFILRLPRPTAGAPPADLRHARGGQPHQLLCAGNGKRGIKKRRAGGDSFRLFCAVSG